MDEHVWVFAFSLKSFYVLYWIKNFSSLSSILYLYWVKNTLQLILQKLLLQDNGTTLTLHEFKHVQWDSFSPKFHGKWKSTNCTIRRKLYWFMNENNAKNWIPMRMQDRNEKTHIIHFLLIKLREHYFGANNHVDLIGHFDVNVLNYLRKWLAVSWISQIKWYGW